MPFFKLNDYFAKRYLLTELIGEGTSHELWKARDQLGNKALVLLKIHIAAAMDEEEGINEFRQEYYQSQQFAHPHLLPVYHFDIWENMPYLLMPYTAGGSLASMLEKEGTFSERQAALVLSQIGSALEKLHAHEPSRVHHNVRPDNILASQSDYFLLANLEIKPENWKPYPYESEITSLDEKAYYSPESFDELLETDSASDIFSLGVTVFQLCTNMLPWGGEGGQALYRGGVMPELPEHFSNEFNELLQSCLAVDKEKRPKARELHIRAKHYLETGSWNLNEKVSGEGSRIKKILPYGIAAAFLLLIVAGALYQYNNDDMTPHSERYQRLSNSTEKGQEVDQMLLDMLEQERNDLEIRARDLEEKNRILSHNDSINRMILKSQEKLLKEYNVRSQKPEPAFAATVPNSATSPESNKRVTGAENRPVSTKTNVSTGTSSPPATSRANGTQSPKELEQQLNKISQPGLTAAARTAWKEETMAKFAEGSIRIFDETEGSPKQYSPSIFLNLLINVPHTIVVNEVKSDQNQKVTELRLTMVAKK